VGVEMEMPANGGAFDWQKRALALVLDAEKSANPHVFHTEGRVGMARGAFGAFPPVDLWHAEPHGKPWNMCWKPMVCGR